MDRLKPYNKHKLTEEQKREIHDGASTILGAVVVGLLVALIVWSLPDWQWVHG